MDNSCQLCGKTDGRLSTQKIAGAQVTVCHECRPNTASKSKSEDTSSEKKSKKVKMGNTRGYTISNPNPDWVGGVDYGNKTPYLRQNYAQEFHDALEQSEMTIDELAVETGLSEETLTAVSEKEATTEGVTAEELTQIENALNIELIHYTE